MVIISLFTAKIKIRIYSLYKKYFSLQRLRTIGRGAILKSGNDKLTYWVFNRFENGLTNFIFGTYSNL